MLEAAEGRLLADLDLARVVQAGEEAEHNAREPELVGQVVVLLDVLELVDVGSIDLEKKRMMHFFFFFGIISQRN